MRKLAALPLAALAIAACADGPTATTEPTETSAPSAAIVITPGAAAPAAAPRTGRPLLSAVGSTSVSLGGSTASPVVLKAASCGAESIRSVTVTYNITGRQDNPASFVVPTRWVFNGASWVSSVPTTVSIPARAAADPATVRMVTLSVENGSATSTGTSSFTIVPGSVITSAPAALNVTNGNVQVFVAFDGCAPLNTAPSIVVPANMTLEATSNAGAVATWVVTANDAQDGDISANVVCTPASGSVFPLGTTTVNCSVTDAGGLSASGSFTVKVQDTTPPAFSVSNNSLFARIATSASGWTLDLANLGISATDIVDGVVTPVCTPADGSVLPIGVGAFASSVSCTATDAAGNTSTLAFKVEVGLNVNATGFLTPLRMAAPFSAHKLGSTIPHKFLPPTYADGTPATDLVFADLRLVLQRISGASPVEVVIEDGDYSAGSTSWRYDVDAGHYIYNVKTSTKAPWADGHFTTTASYKGIVIATTELDLRK